MARPSPWSAAYSKSRLNNRNFSSTYRFGYTNQGRARTKPNPKTKNKPNPKTRNQPETQNRDQTCKVLRVCSCHTYICFCKRGAFGLTSQSSPSESVCQFAAYNTDSSVVGSPENTPHLPLKSHSFITQKGRGGWAKNFQSKYLWNCFKVYLSTPHHLNVVGWQIISNLNKRCEVRHLTH